MRRSVVELAANAADRGGVRGRVAAYVDMAQRENTDRDGALEALEAKLLEGLRTPERDMTDVDWATLREEAKAERDRRLAEHRANPSSAVPWSELRASLPKS